ncbi:hypothetical protein bcgnr5371_60870 [Bacillus cereus]
MSAIDPKPTFSSTANYYSDIVSVKINQSRPFRQVLFHQLVAFVRRSALTLTISDAYTEL